MRKIQVSFSLLAFAFMGASSMPAQNFENLVPQFGIKVGVPVTDMFDASNTSLFNGNQNVPGSTYSSAVPRYELGVSGEFKFPFHMRLEVDGLFKRASFASQNNVAAFFGPSYLSTSMDVFEVPALLKYNIARGHFRPFVDFGASLRHVANIRTYDFADDFSTLTLDKNSTAFHNRNSFGGVAGFGITFKKGPLEFSPEARYTRWANESFQTAGLRTNLDQGDVLLGITF